MEPARFALIVIMLMTAWTFAKIGLIGFAMYWTAAAPKYTARVHEAYTQRKTRCLIVGVVNLILLPFLSVLLISTQVLALPGLLVFAGTIALIAIGLGAHYREVGRRLFGDTYSLAGTVMRGGAVAEASFYVPLAGQILMAVIAARGLGAVVITLLSRSARVEAPDEDAAQSDAEPETSA